MDPFIGQIILWPCPFVPEGWALCDGSIYKVSDYQALYSLIGNTYGGTASSTFALPDLRSKVPVGAAAVNGAGQKSGADTATVTAVGTGSVSIGVANLPSHTHAATFTPGGGGASVSIAIPADSTGETDNVPGTGLVLGKGMAGATPAKVYSSNAANTTLKPFSVNVPAGGGTVVNANTG
ncbi:MAG: tail fiber protein, partial [Pseudomonadota bacterium]